jgi:hypothetical protein
LIPKIYVVAVERAPLVPSVTFHLRGDTLYDYAESSLTIDVDDLGPPPPVDEPPPPELGDVIGEFDAPTLGDAVSVLAEDGLPIWLVRHLDGSVSAVPAVVAVPEQYGPEGFSMLVLWVPDGRRFGGPSTWDEWGRALVDGRDDDLTGLHAELVGETVVVREAAPARVPGEPVFDGTPSAGQWERAELPPLTDLPSPLVPGWLHVEAGLVREGDVHRVCAGHFGFDVLVEPTCATDAPLAPITGGPPLDPATALWMGGPLLIHVNDDLLIDVLVTLGGTAGTMAATPTTTSP